MCNYLHEDSVEIPEKGIGWKIFNNNRTCFISLVEDYIKEDDGFVHWKEIVKTDKDEFFSCGHGFCFFLSEEEANRLLNDLHNYGVRTYKNHNVKKIEYDLGLGKHLEDNIVSDKKYKKYETALAKKFRIIE